MKQKVYTSLNLPVFLIDKLKLCTHIHKIDMSQLLSVLCYRAGKFVCKKVNHFKTVDYQERGQDYEILPVYFFVSDHEYMHANRLSCKISVSYMLACTMAMFLDEIMQKGINEKEIAQVRIIQHSYKKKSFKYRNFSFQITKLDQLEEYNMKIRTKKT